MQCRAVSRHDAIDDGTQKCGIGQSECAGHKGCCHQQSQLPPIGPGEAKSTQQTLASRFHFRRQIRLIFAQTCIGVWGWIAKHVFLPILYQMKNAQAVLKRNLRPKRLGGSEMEGKCQDCASNVRPNLLASAASKRERIRFTSAITICNLYQYFSVILYRGVVKHRGMRRHGSE